MQLKPDELLYVRLMAKNVRVTAVFLDDDGDKAIGRQRATQYLLDHSDEAVAAQFGPLILMAKMNDMGE